MRMSRAIWRDARARAYTRTRTCSRDHAITRRATTRVLALS